MGLSANAKAKSRSSSTGENRGMGFLLVFFPEENNNNNNNGPIVDRNKLLSSPSSSSPSPSSSSLSPSTSTRIKRTKSSLIFTKAQSTISICALLVFLTLLLFTLSTFEPTLPTPTTTTKSSPRFLSQNYPNNLNPKIHLNSTISSSWFFKRWNNNYKFSKSDHTKGSEISSINALQRMGVLYRRGTRAMNDLLVAHLVEDVTENEFRLFLRVLYRSALTARADIVFVFGSNSSVLPRFGSLIQEENESFLKLIHHYRKVKGTSRNSVLGFNVTRFVKSGKKDMGEPFWGKRIRGNYSNEGESEGEGESTRLSYGSVVGFEASELDPENALAGFLDHVPMSLRRWACYPMLLGRVRRNFKHVMLVDVKNLVLLGDPLGRVRNRSPESVYLLTKPESSSGKHGRRNSDKTQSHFPVNSAILMGGARGIRRLSNAMLTGIVRAAMQQHKRKNPVTESGILSQLVGNSHILKTINLITSTESTIDTNSLTGLSSNSAAISSLGDFTIVHRGDSNHDSDSTLMKQICSCEVDSSVYTDC